MSIEMMKAAVQSSPDCPSLEALLAAAELATDSPERQAVERHLARCISCSKELALLGEFERDDALPEESEPVEWIAARLAATSCIPNSNDKVVEIAPPRRVRSWISTARLGALSAAAVLILSVGIFFSRHTPQPIVGGNDDTLRSAPLRALAPTGDLSAPPEQFQWSAVNGAVRYLFRVSEVDGTTVFETRIAATSLPLPGEIRKLLQPGRTFLWSVWAEDSSGREIGNSAGQYFRLEPRQSN